MKSKKNKERAWYILFTAPLIVIFFLVEIIPFFLGVGYSFFSWDGLPLNPMVFVGFNNFIRLFHDSRFMSAAGHTIVFTIFSVVLVNVVGLIFALLGTSRLTGHTAARTMLFMPYLIGGLILGYIWKFILGDALAAVGKATGWTGFFFNWLSHPKTALLAMIIVNCWQMAGYIMIIYITGIQAIPDDVIEAAQVDGASFWQTLFKVKFPLLMPSFTICLFMTLSNCFKIYDVNLSLTGGGPASSTEMFAMNIFNEIFDMSNYGYGQAKAFVFFIIIAVVALIQVSTTRRKEVEL